MRYCLDLPNLASIIGQWLYDWQTLISGLLALLAAGATILYLKKQITQTDVQHKTELERRHNAVRAIIPLALTLIDNWLRRTEDRLWNMGEDPQELIHLPQQQLEFENQGGEGLLSHSFFAVDSISDDTMNMLKEFLETTSDVRVIENISNMVWLMQDLQNAARTMTYSDAESYWSGIKELSSTKNQLRQYYNEIDSFCRNSIGQSHL